MDCSNIRDELYGYLKGWVEESDEPSLKTHLANCPSCTEELESLRRTLTPLAEVEEITPSNQVWQNITREIEKDLAPVPAAAPIRSERRFRLVRGLIGLAAAASVLVAALSFLLLYMADSGIAATVSDVKPGTDGTDLRIGQSVRMHEVLTARSYTHLTIPDVGSLKLNRATKIEFLSRRRVRLHSGEVFAEIHPGGSGFVVECPDATATVAGTRFGLRTGDSTMLYVVEGQVDLSNDGESLRVRAEQAAVAAPTPELVERENASRFADWVAAYESPSLLIEAVAGRKAWDVTLSTNSIHPIYLPNFQNAASELYARIESPQGEMYVVPLDCEAVRVLDALSGPNDQLRLDVSNACRLSVKLEAGLFRSGPGSYKVRIGFFGKAESLPVTVEAGR